MTTGALADQQRALLDALFVARPGQTESALSAGIAVYRANGHAHAERALAAAYPVVSALLGDEGTVPLARALWHHAPPERGDLARWGAALADFIGAQPAFGGMPWLPDVARIEWALHSAAHAEGQLADFSTFERLIHNDPDQLHLQLAPGTVVIECRWPVLGVIEAHRPGGPDLATAGERLRTDPGEWVRVWRQGWQVSVARVTADAAAFERALLDGMSLGAALAMAPIDIGPWLQLAASEGRLLAVIDRPGQPVSPPGEASCTTLA